MAEWIGGVQCIHGLACGILMSMFLSLAIQATVSFSSNTCDDTGIHLEQGNSSCQYTEERKWALGLFYSGAAVALLGSFATCQSSGNIMIIHFIALLIWIGTFIGYSIFRMQSDDLSIIDAFNSVTEDVIRDKWGFWAQLVRWVLGVGMTVSAITSIVVILYYCHYKRL